MAKLESVMLCYPGHLSVEIAISKSKLEILANSSNIMYAQPEVLQSLLAALDPAMQEPISTFVGGVPGKEFKVFLTLSICRWQIHLYICVYHMHICLIL